MLKLKVCGMRDCANTKKLIELQPDFIGFIFHEESTRNVSKPIAIQVPKHSALVGVFVNKPKAFIADKVDKYNLNHIQLHGAESPEFCNEIKELGVGVLKAFNISEAFDFSILNDYESVCDYFLFDALGKNAGGNGITFNWKLLSNYKGKLPFLLSGGIDATMVNLIKDIKHPKFIGIDINSGFEIKPAFKDIAKIKSFSTSVRNIKIS